MNIFIVLSYFNYSCLISIRVVFKHKPPLTSTDEALAL